MNNLTVSPIYPRKAVAEEVAGRFQKEGLFLEIACYDQELRQEQRTVRALT